MPNKERYFLSVSYASYIESLGGTDKVIYTQQKYMNQNGCNFIHIYPIKNYGKVYFKKANQWGILLNGNFIASRSTKDICSYIKSNILKESIIERIYIHHIMNIYLPYLCEILDRIKAPIYFYLHDYYTMSLDYNLMNVNKEVICINQTKEWTPSQNDLIHYKAVSEFFSRYSNRLEFIAPSDTVKNIWCMAFDEYKDKVKVFYHQKFSGVYLQNKEQLDKNSKINVAFVGLPQKNKGWEIWQKLIDIQNKKQQTRYKFYHFSKISDPQENVENVFVDFKISLTAMIDSLREKEIHCAILWSQCPETYSYTYYECFASNAYIITNSKSGNIAFQTLDRKNGIVLEDDEQLYKLFSDEEKLFEKINEFRSRALCGPNRLNENFSLLDNHLENKISAEIINENIKTSLNDYFFTFLIRFRNRIKRINLN